MGGPLIDRAWRRVALVVGTVGAAVFLSLAVLIFHAKRTAFDSWFFRVLPERIPDRTAQFLIGFTEPALSVVLLALVVVLAASVRRFDLAVLAVVGPSVGTVLASAVAKPIIHRTLLGGTVGSFPSGHETGVTCTAAVLLVAVGQLPLRRGGKYAVATVLAVWVLLAAVGLTRFYYHYATDTIGSIGLSLAFVLGLAALLDRFWPATWSDPGRAGRPDRPGHPGRPRSRPGPAPRPASSHRPLPPARRPADRTDAQDQLTPRS